jgi:fumarate reductase subunit D
MSATSGIRGDGSSATGRNRAGAPMRRNDRRARGHPGFLLAMAHRLSGLALALFLPLHFLTLGAALQGAAALDITLDRLDMPLFKLGEWALVVLLAVHSSCGVRLLVIEFRPWSGSRKNWWTAVVGVGVAAGIAFGLALLGPA